MKQHVVIKTDVSNILVLKDNFEDDSQKMTESAVHIGVPPEWHTAWMTHRHLYHLYCRYHFK